MFLRQLFLVGIILISVAFAKESKPTERLTFGDITYTYHEGDDESLLTIRKKKHLVATLREHRISLCFLGYGKFVGDAEPKPYLVVMSHGGGAHGPSLIKGYILKPSFKQICAFSVDGTIKLVKDGPATDFLIEGPDPSFLMWHNSYAYSAFVTLRLKPGPGKYGLVISTDHMPSYFDEQKLMAQAKALREDADLWKEADVYPGKVVEQIALLTYANKPELAEKFFEAAWNPNHAGKEPFKKDFVALMQKNDLWHDLVKQKDYKLPFVTPRHADN